MFTLAYRQHNPPFSCIRPKLSFSVGPDETPYSKRITFTLLATVRFLALGFEPSCCSLAADFFFFHTFPLERGRWGVEKNKGWSFLIGYICVACHSWFSTADVSCLAQLAVLCHFTRQAVEGLVLVAEGGGTATVFLFNEPTDNGLWGALERYGTNCLVLWLGLTVITVRHGRSMGSRRNT